MAFFLAMIFLVLSIIFLFLDAKYELKTLTVLKYLSSSAMIVFMTIYGVDKKRKRDAEH